MGSSEWMQTLSIDAHYVFIIRTFSRDITLQVQPKRKTKKKTATTTGRRGKVRKRHPTVNSFTMNDIQAICWLNALTFYGILWNNIQYTRNAFVSCNLSMWALPDLKIYLAFAYYNIDYCVMRACADMSVSMSMSVPFAVHHINVSWKCVMNGNTARVWAISWLSNNKSCVVISLAQNTNTFSAHGRWWWLKLVHHPKAKVWLHKHCEANKVLQSSINIIIDAFSSNIPTP